MQGLFANPIFISLFYVLISCLIILLSRVVFDQFALFKVGKEIKKKAHTPVIAFGGYLFGIVCILVGAYGGQSSNNFILDFAYYVLYCILGLILMTISGLVAQKVILRKFDNAKELLEDANIGTAAVHFGVYLSSGLIIAGCISGETSSQVSIQWADFLSTIVYYVLGMAFMFLFTMLYDKLTPYSIHEEIEKDNFSVGIALSGNIIAIGIILTKATIGENAADLTIMQNAAAYAIDLTAILLLLPVVRLILGNFLVKTVVMNEEIKNNNVAAGLIEFISIISFALLIFFMVDFTSVV